jgi:hypothetical protein
MYYLRKDGLKPEEDRTFRVMADDRLFDIRVRTFKPEAVKLPLKGVLTGSKLNDLHDEALLHLEHVGLPAVRPIGIAERVDEGNGILVTEFLRHSLQYRRLLMRVPLEPGGYRDRLLDAMAGLLVDLHRAGVYWGDCSLATTLFRRDGDTFAAYLVDAETSEVHPALSDGQQSLDPAQFARLMRELRPVVLCSGRDENRVAGIVPGGIAGACFALDRLLEFQPFRRRRGVRQGLGLLERSGLGVANGFQGRVRPGLYRRGADL